MRAVHGYVRTQTTKIWFCICWWDGEPMQLPLAA